ncbi:MAG TPA: GAF domain-containing protein [Aggregatilinea sp.]|uniref:ATP-binding protein n=1 Tax=Aggregatilinea sp. TaxID=2806333 RepID=UPI002C18B735|nr:ATP-binding protein [Aggregatilinea sp.]HML24003.1 GAF domain-containing protein [Aggregatilinea sp.]
MREPLTILWLGGDCALLDAAWQQFDVVNIRTSSLLPHVLNGQVAACVVDCEWMGESSEALLARVREIRPDTALIALTTGATNGKDLQADAVLSRSAPPDELLHLLTYLQPLEQESAPQNEMSTPARVEVLEKRLAHLEGLLQSALNVPGSIRESNILADLRHVARVAVDADNIAVLLVDPSYSDVSDALHLGVSKAYVATCQETFQSLSPEQRMVYLGDEVMLRTVGTDTPASAQRREAESMGARSYMRLPLIIDNHIIGFVGLFSETPGRFDGGHLQLGRLFAAQVATAVRNLRLSVRLNRAEQRQRAVGEVARLIAEDLTVDRLLNRIVDEAVRLVGGNVGSVTLVQPDRSLIVSAANPPDLIPVGFRFEPGQGMAGMIVLSRQPMVVADYKQWENAVPELAQPMPPGATLFGVPLTYRDRVLGVLQVAAMNMPPEDVAEARETLLMLAPQAAIAISKAQLHETVRQERQQLRAILDHTAAGVMVCDAEGRVQLVNPEARRILSRLGLEYEAIHDRRVVDLLREVAPDQDIQALSAPIIELDLGVAGEYLLHIAPIATPTGEIERYVAVAQDISQLRRLDRMKSDLIHILSHDLRNPLGLARGSIDLLDEPDLDASQREQLMGMIVNSLERMEQLIQDVSDLEMAESLGHETAQPYQLPAMVQRMVLRNLPKAERQGLTLTYHEARVPPHTLTGHAILVGQAVDNLISNAIKYTPYGSIDVTLTVEGDYAVVYVKDTGVGIPEDSLQYVFDQFYRVHDERTRNIPGTGLGLSLVQTIARTHGGWVTVRSQLDVGSEFSFALPIAERQQKASPANAVKRLDLSGLVKPQAGTGD